MKDRLEDNWQITGINEKMLRKWLSNLVMPWIVKPSFFEDMGFDPVFVRRFLRKHTNVWQSGRQVRHGVIGINEADFLMGLAETLKVDISLANRSRSSTHKIRLIAEACIGALDHIKFQCDPHSQESGATRLIRDCSKETKKERRNERVSMPEVACQFYKKNPDARDAT